jgi:site-specific recombinase XerD
MNQFEEYLKLKKYRNSTITAHIANVNRFFKWASSQGYKVQDTSYNNLLNYIQASKSRGVSKASINNHLQSIAIYLECLISKNVRNDNPCKALRVKDTDKKVIKNVLSNKELEAIYLGFVSIELSNKQSITTQLRNSIVLGLIVYQGLQNIELQKLEVKHINLSLGNIYIPSTHRSNSRTLKLNSIQILSLQNFINTLPKTQERLLNCDINAVVFTIIKTLKSNNSNVQSISQLRKSVIMNWLKNNNIRQVQYMLGHKHISSTEAYKHNDLTDLQSALELYHPSKQQ